MNWLERQISALMLASYGVESDMLKQIGGVNGNDSDKIRDQNYGTLLNDLQTGVLSDEVKRLRWRNYKILNTLNSKDNRKVELKKHLTYDDGLELILFYEPKREINSLATTLHEVLEHGSTEFKGSEMDSILKDENKHISIKRDSLPKYKIEDLFNKLVLKEHGDRVRIEFYIPNITKFDNKTHNLWVKDLSKTHKTNGKNFNISDILELEIYTKDMYGYPDNYYLKFGNVRYTGINLHKGEFILTYDSDMIEEPLNIYDKYIHSELEASYKNKSRRDEEV